MAPKAKTIEQYEAEAIRLGSGCLVHSGRVARKVNILRHGPTELCVLHKCDTPLCILDEHHFRGTKKDNAQDAVAKGRHSGFRKGGVRFTGPHIAEAKRRIAKAAKTRWGNKEYKSKAIAKMNIVWQNPELRKRLSATRKRQWQDPEFRARMIAARKKRANHA